MYLLTYLVVIKALYYSGVTMQPLRSISDIYLTLSILSTFFLKTGGHF